MNTVDFEQSGGSASMTLNGNVHNYSSPVVTVAFNTAVVALRINDVAYFFVPGVDSITIGGVLMTSQTPAQIANLISTTIFNASSGGSTSGVSANSPIPIYNKSFWADTSDFTVTGMSLTINSDNSIRIPTGASDFTKYMIINGTTNADENIDFEIIFKPTALSAGISIGKKCSNTFFSRSLTINLDFSGATTFLKVTDSVGGSIYSASIAPLPTAGDMISLTYSIRANVLNVFYRNLTSGTSGYFAQSPPIISNLHPSDGSINWQIPNTGNFCIWNNNGGPTDILSLKITSFSNPSPKIMWVGDSKIQGIGAYYINSRLPNLCKSLGSFTVMAGGGDRLIDILTTTTYLSKFRPKYVVLCAGRNDISFGSSSATYEANYLSLVNFFKSQGATVIHLKPIPESGLDQSTLSSWISSTFTGDPIIDSSVGWVNGTDLSAVDNVHPNPAGYRLLANLVKSSGYIVNNNDQYESIPFTDNILDVLPPSASGQFLTSGSDIHYDAGNLGVGRAPTVGLDVYSASATRQILVQSDLTTGSAFFEALNNGGAGGLYFGMTGTAWVTALNTAANYAFIWGTNGIVALIIQTNGTGGSAAPIIFSVNGGEVARFTANGDFSISTGKAFLMPEGSNGRVGQVALVAGTKAITITGLTTSSRGFLQLVTPNTASSTIQYKAVCTANTLTITALVAAGTINASDVSTLNYFVIN